MFYKFCKTSRCLLGLVFILAAVTTVDFIPRALADGCRIKSGEQCSADCPCEEGDICADGTCEEENFALKTLGTPKFTPHASKILFCGAKAGESASLGGASYEQALLRKCATDCQVKVVECGDHGGRVKAVSRCSLGMGPQGAYAFGEITCSR